jgi:hypothetical protein
MSSQANWQLYADRFVWYDVDNENSLMKIPEEVSDSEVQRYLFTYQSQNLTLEAIHKLRKGIEPSETDQ